MTIDYDRLREQLEDFDQAESHHAKWVALEALRAHAAPMARELLLLRDGVKQLVDSKRPAAELMRKRADTNWRYDAERYIADAVDEMCDNLTRVIQGDTE